MYNLIPLPKYLNEYKQTIAPGQCLLYQNVNHPANSHKRLVTFKRWTNTGLAVEEFPGTLYPGNFWIALDSSGIPIKNSEYPAEVHPL
jgi:hypothetical protein